MTNVLREYDICCRWGGEEFLLLFPRVHRWVCFDHCRASCLLQAVAEAPRPDEVTEGVTISIGYTLFQPGEGIDETLLRADRALYQAKEQGRNCSVGL